MSWSETGGKNPELGNALGLELPRRNNVCFVEKEGVGGLNVNVTHSFWRKK